MRWIGPGGRVRVRSAALFGAWGLRRGSCRMTCGSGWNRCCHARNGGFDIQDGSRSRIDRCCAASSVLHTGIQWDYLPKELGFGSGMTCWRRLRDWNEAGV
ncbi:transposase [Streptomyces microflavus]|uniref:transposase n=2 Tax=Streptomyces griseus group TaxID=629295 RepID=UPI0036674DEC